MSFFNLKLKNSISKSFSTLSSLFSSSGNSQIVNEIPKSSSITALMKSSPADLMNHFVKVMTKGGHCRDDIVARVNSKLKQRYGVEYPIQVAVDAVKPVLKFQRFKHSKQYVPIVLHGKSAEGIAIRWIVNSAHSKEYLGKRNLERGLFDEIDSILQGTSSVYQKRFNFHRNPN
jgi:ribosomal protein S7